MAFRFDYHVVVSLVDSIPHRIYVYANLGDMALAESSSLEYIAKAAFVVYAAKVVFHDIWPPTKRLIVKMWEHLRRFFKR